MKDRFKTFTVLISKISRCIKRIKAEVMRDFNLKCPHISCLYYLYKEKSLTAKELTDICYEDKASISRSLDYLEVNGFIFCEANTKKRYRSRLNLTEKGKEAGRILAEKIDNILEKASIGLNEESRVILYQSLGLISNNLENYYKNEGEKIWEY